MSTQRQTIATSPSGFRRHFAVAVLMFAAFAGSWWSLKPANLERELARQVAERAKQRGDPPRQVDGDPPDDTAPPGPDQGPKSPEPPGTAARPSSPKRPRTGAVP